MTPKFKYRLEPVLEQKERAKKDAEKALAQARAALEAEKKTLEELEAEKQSLLDRIEESRHQRDQKAMEGELTVQASRQYKLFIQRLHEERKEADVRIYKQTRVVERAEVEVQKAKDHLLTCAREHEAMSKHKEQWIKQQELELQKKEQKIMEEIGMVQHLKKQREDHR